MLSLHNSWLFLAKNKKIQVTLLYNLSVKIKHKGVPVTMKSIEQIDQQNETKSLISLFTHLIGLGKLAKRVNFKRKSFVSLSMIVSWLISVHFARHSLYRATKDDHFSIRTARNVLNDG